METATLPPPAALLPRDLSSRKTVPYSVELLESLDDTIENYINGGAAFNGEAIEEEDEEDEVVVASGEKNRSEISLVS
jgi:hypothetical protein